MANPAPKPADVVNAVLKATNRTGSESDRKKYTDILAKVDDQEAMAAFLKAVNDANQLAGDKPVPDEAIRAWVKKAQANGLADVSFNAFNAFLTAVTTDKPATPQPPAAAPPAQAAAPPAITPPAAAKKPVELIPPDKEGGLQLTYSADGKKLTGTFTNSDKIIKADVPVEDEAINGADVMSKIMLTDKQKTVFLALMNGDPAAAKETLTKFLNSGELPVNVRAAGETPKPPAPAAPAPAAQKPTPEPRTGTRPSREPHRTMEADPNGDRITEELNRAELADPSRFNREIVNSHLPGRDLEPALQSIISHQAAPGQTTAGSPAPDAGAEEARRLNQGVIDKVNAYNKAHPQTASYKSMDYGVPAFFHPGVVYAPWTGHHGRPGFQFRFGFGGGGHHHPH